MVETNRSRKLTVSTQTGFLRKWYLGWIEGFTFRQILVGLGMAMIIALVVFGYEFQRLPDYEQGSIADRDITAPHDFTVRDVVAIEKKQNESLESVPAVFDLEISINSRLEKTLRSSFSKGREVISQLREEKTLSENQFLSELDLELLLKQLKQELPIFSTKDTLVEILLKNSFSSELENQMVSLLQLSMKYPGVIASRDLLFVYRDRSIILTNQVTGREEILSDALQIRDMNQARDLLGQNEFLLTAVQGNSKPHLIAFLADRIEPTVRFNDKETLVREKLAIEQVPPVLIQIKQGHKIIRAGDPVDTQSLMILKELKKKDQAIQPVDQFVGFFLLGIFFVFALWRNLQTYHEKKDEVPSRFFLTGLILVVHLGVAKILANLGEFFSRSLTINIFQDSFNFYWVIPVSFGAILLVLLVGGQLAILYSLPASVFISLMTNELAIGVYTLISSLTAVYALRHYRERAALGRAVLIIGFINILTALALQLQTSSFGWYSFGVRSGLAFLGAIISAMLVSLLLPILENLFRVTTDIRLLELSNLNSPILRRLALEAPGTFHHSLNVGVLAEAAAEAIGANPLLSRVGAYYHDIGKLRKPDYYVENQIFMPNKHENLSPSMSSLILSSHVKDGMQMASEIGLSPEVSALIPEHHGTKVMSFFYQKAKQAARNKQVKVNEEDFRYPGPKPQTKEGAILMLSDQVEAASRTLQDPKPGQVRSMIRRLIQETIQDRQFDECDITTRDLDKITRGFERVITGMYHHRVDYPGFDFNNRLEYTYPEDQSVQ